MNRPLRWWLVRLLWSSVYIGVVLSLLTAGAVLLWGAIPQDTIALLMPALFIGVFFTAMAVSVGKRAGSSLGGKVQLVFLVFMAAVLIVRFRNDKWKRIDVLGEGFAGHSTLRSEGLR